MGRKGFEPLTSRLSVECSSQAELPAHKSNAEPKCVYKYKRDSVIGLRVPSPSKEG